MLASLATTDQTRLVKAMDSIEATLAPPRAAPPPYRLRAPAPGDIGWIVSRHGALYAQEYAWDMTFEALVAEIAARFVRNFDPQHERGWIAERGGENVGSVLVVKQSRAVAKLRLLLVEPSARGQGIGRASAGEGRAPCELRPRARRPELGARPALAKPPRGPRDQAISALYRNRCGRAPSSPRRRFLSASYS